MKHKFNSYIECPKCHKTKDAVMDGTKGQIIHRCSNCGYLIKFNFDLMTAEIAKPIRGLSKSA